MDANGYSILVVDDEPAVVNAVRRELTTPPLGGQHYRVSCFTDGLSALAYAREQAVDLVVSDYRMPGMDGFEFLQQLSGIHPDCARIVLSGQTDLQALQGMVNRTHIFRFIAKPWHNLYLKESIAQALAYRQAFLSNRCLAEQARAHGLERPCEASVEMENVLVVSADDSDLMAISRTLTSRSYLADIFMALHDEGPHEKAEAVDRRGLLVSICNSPFRALEMARDTEYAAVLVDASLLHVEGTDFLGRMLALQPDCERLVLAGEIDLRTLSSAINDAHIFGVVGKSWSEYELKSILAQAVCRRRLLLENRELASLCAAHGIA